MHKRLFFLLLTCGILQQGKAQELQARLSIITSKVSTTVDRKIFQTLQTGLTNFLNNRKWSNDVFQPAEKIQCSFLLTIEEAQAGNVYKGKLTVQAARPIYNTTYDSPILNFIDDDVTFKYVEFQPIEFNENRVQGNDPLAANLTAVLAYYANIIVGLDYASFNLRGGDPFFQKAWNIVNNAPESGNQIDGWKSFESLRNRYWLAENLNNSRFAMLHDAVYSYYRSGMDIFYENEEAGRSGILNALNFLSNLSRDNPNSMILQVFFQGKSNELVKVFSKAGPDVKTRAREVLTKLDLTNSNAYKELK
ncbi:MAG: DUF4835 family protein [Chitinophagaceae bacterium]|jgi:Domain of unknown function (DUF4835)|nr:DUF4835 family protein [Chitinophagaceae bacterium]